jgi:hypothetical protein
MKVARCGDVGHPGGLALRAALWPRCSHGEHAAEMAVQIAPPGRCAAFVADDDRGEFASDASLASTDSHAMHRAPGFVETGRVVYFRQLLR